MALLSPDQRLKLFTWTSCVVGPLSVFGSMLTLLTLYRSRSTDSRFRFTTYHRLMIGISILDMMLSFALALGPLPLPRDLDFTLPTVKNTYGTQRTCSMQVFFVVLGAGSFVYQSSLMVTFVLLVHGVNDELIRKRIEPFLHLISVGFFLGVAIAGLVLGVYNSAGALCWLASDPIACTEIPGVECRRGEHVVLFRLWFSVVPLMAVCCVQITCLLILTSTVWWRRRYEQRQSGGGSETMNSRSRMVMTQSLLYGITMTNCIFWTFVASINGIKGDTPDFQQQKHFWIDVLALIFFPLQGVFNFLIFIRPRYIAIRKNRRGPTLSRFRALVEAVFYPHGRGPSSTATTEEMFAQPNSETGNTEHREGLDNNGGEAKSSESNDEKLSNESDEEKLSSESNKSNEDAAGLNAHKTANAAASATTTNPAAAAASQYWEDLSDESSSDYAFRTYSNDLRDEP